jgi:hypothetical protein
VKVVNTQGIERAVMVADCAPLPVKLKPLLALLFPLRRADVGVIVHAGPLQETTKVGIQAGSGRNLTTGRTQWAWIPTFVGNLLVGTKNTLCGCLSSAGTFTERIIP